MTDAVRKLLEQALALSPDERGDLARRLLATVDEEEDEDDAAADAELALAKDPGTSAAQLSRLADSEDVRVLEAVGEHANTPPAALDGMADTGWVWVMANRNTPEAARARVAANGDKLARAAAARHTSDPALLERLAADPESDVRAEVAHNDSATAAVLAVVAAQPDAMLHFRTSAAFEVASDTQLYELVIQHPAVTPEILESMGEAPNIRVVRALFHHPLTPKGVVKRLKKRIW